MRSKATDNVSLVVLIAIAASLCLAVLLVGRDLKNNQVSQSLALVVSFKFIQHLIDWILVAIKLSQLNIAVVNPNRFYFLFYDVFVRQIKIQHDSHSVVRQYIRIYEVFTPDLASRGSGRVGIVPVVVL